MRIIFLIFFFTLSTLSANAEYNGWFIKFTIEKVDGKKTVGYMYVADGYFDKSLKDSAAYVLEKFRMLDGDSQDSIISFHRNMICYEHSVFFDTTQSTKDYALYNSTKINIARIKRIIINEMIDHDYLTTISNQFTSKDTTWIKTKPLKSEYAAAYLCDFQIFCHEYNSEIKLLIKQLKAQCRKINETENSEEERKLFDLINKLTKYKVVVVSTCTC